MALHGLNEGLGAIDAAIRAGRLAKVPMPAPVLLRAEPTDNATLTEAEA